MFLMRQELNVTTGEITKVVQQAYKNEDGYVVVLDAGEDAPDGYEEFDPTENPEV